MPNYVELKQEEATRIKPVLSREMLLRTIREGSIRKLSLEDTLCFVSSTFYLDLKDEEAKRYISRKLLLFKGNVESFLSKQVNYIVTDKVEGVELFKHSASSPSFNIFSPRSSSFESSVESPLSSPLVRNTNNRSSMILCKGVEAARKQNKGTSSIFEVAKNWGIPVLDSRCVVQVIRTHALYVDAVYRKKIKETQENLKPHEKRKLKDPFIKVEDKKCCYRPFFKELGQWPELVSRSSTPFLPPKNSKQDVQQQERKPLTAVNQEITSMSTKTTSVRNSTNASLKGINRRVDYCDICMAHYTNIKKHITTPLHRSYMMDPKNYAEVIEVMKYLPKTMDGLVTSSTSVSNDKANTGRIRSTSTFKPSPFSSNGATVRRLDGSVTAKHFLPVHEWPVSSFCSPSLQVKQCTKQPCNNSFAYDNHKNNHQDAETNVPKGNSEMSSQNKDLVPGSRDTDDSDLLLYLEKCTSLHDCDQTAEDEVDNMQVRNVDTILNHFPYKALPTNNKDGLDTCSTALVELNHGQPLNLSQDFKEAEISTQHQSTTPITKENCIYYETENKLFSPGLPSDEANETSSSFHCCVDSYINLQLSRKLLGGQAQNLITEDAVVLDLSTRELTTSKDK